MRYTFLRIAILFIISSIDKDIRTQKNANEISDTLLPHMAESQVILRENEEIKKLFVEPVLQGNRIGSNLLIYAIENHNANTLWALEKNTRAIRFYKRHGFRITADKKLEEDTTEYLVRLER